MKKIHLFLIIFCHTLFSHDIYGQMEALIWAKSTGSSFVDQGVSIAVDSIGNSYTVGFYRGIVDFDPGPGVFNISSNSAAWYDIFITKLAPDGSFKWTKSIGGSLNDQPTGIVLDKTGGILISGLFTSIVDFDPNVTVFNLSAGGSSEDAFVLKLDTAGNFVWAKQFIGTSNARANAIALDANGNVFTTGVFNSTCDFDPGAGAFPLTASAQDIFVCKLNTIGDFVWAKKIGGPVNDVGYTIAVDNIGNVYTGGSFESTVDFDPGASIVNFTSLGQRDIFISKLDNNGNYLWAKAVGGTTTDHCFGITTDALDNVISTGWFEGTVDFNPNIGVANISSLGAQDAFILKLNSAGNYLWATSIGRTGFEMGTDITVDALDNIYTTGTFSGSNVDFEPGIGIYNLSASGGFEDAFIQKLDASGNFISAVRMGGINYDRGVGIALDKLGNIFSTGFFNVTSDFDPGAGVFNLVSAGSSDAFFLKLGCRVPPNNTTNMSNLSICYGNNTVLTAIGTGTLDWYSASTGGTYLGGGTSYTTAILTSTVTFYVQDSSSCGVSLRTPVTVNVSPSATITVNSGSICSGQSFTITPSGANTYTIQGGSAIKTPTATTNYTVSGTSAAGCVSSTFATSSITVNTTPTITVNSGSICSGQSFTITPGGANTYTTQGGSAVKTPTTGASYTVAGTSSAGCVSSTFATSSITVNTTPTITVNSGSICSSQSFTITPGGANTYTIQGGSAVKTPTTSASYTVAGTSSAGCVSSTFATSSITVNTTPTITVNSGNICSGQSFTITPGGANTYTIQGGGAIKTPTTNTTYTVIGASTAGCVSNSPATSTITVNAVPTISVNGGVICSGQSFTITPSGANTYTIQGGSAIKTPTATTNYTVSGTSAAGCISSTFATSSITVNTTPTIAVNSGSICLGQSFTITPGGANTYTFSNGNVVNPTTNTTYTVTGTGLNGCVNSTGVISSVTVNTTPTITIANGAICLGNSFTLSPSGANSFTFSSGSSIVSPTTTTSYSVSGTSSAGCITNTPAIVTVTVASTLNVAITGNNTICGGDVVNLTANGATTYTWSTGAISSTIAPSPASNTTYSVIGASGSCSNTAVISVTVNTLPTINATTSNTLMCTGQIATLTASGASTYTWNPGGASASISVSPTVTTTYTIDGTDANGCSNMATVTQSVSLCTGINQITNSINAMTLFPNPCANNITVQTDEDIQVAYIFNTLGGLVQTENTKTFSVEKLSSGIYIMHVKTEKGTGTIRFIKE